jgi:hypothetical protein
MKITRDKLDTPDLSIAGLQIWIHGREFPKYQGSFDGDWLIVTIHCGGKGADVWVQGPIIHLSEIENWLKQVDSMYKTFKGKVEFFWMNPNFSVRMEIGKRGQLSLIVEITPENLEQQHKFTFNIDQSYLPPLIKELKAILKNFPIKDIKI